MADKSPENKGNSNLLAQYRQMSGHGQEMDKQTKERTEGFGENLTPLTPMETQMAKKPAEGSEQPQSSPQQLHNRSTTAPQSSESTRDRQGEINRMNQDGQPITPRLAQEERVPSINKPKSLANQATESAVKSAAKVLIPTLGSGVAGGIIAYLIA